MSRIEKAEMFLRLKNYISEEEMRMYQEYKDSVNIFGDYNLYVYAPSYNVLRFMSGMASLVFSN